MNEARVAADGQDDRHTHKIGKMRILLTEDCNANCPHCFNKGFRKAGHMDTARARRVFEFLGQHLDSLLIMGGEPTLHPDFVELYAHAQRCFRQVALFTNALNDQLLRISPRPGDGITYNARLIGRDFDYRKMHPGKQCGRALDLVLTSREGIDELKARVVRSVNNAARHGIKDLGFVLTLDITEDNFKHRELLNRGWRSLLSFIWDIGIERLEVDHPVPSCFWDEESKRLHARLPQGIVGQNGSYPSCCRLKSAGLLNSRFEILHCNQSPVKLGSLFAGPLEKAEPGVYFTGVLGPLTRGCG